MRKYGVVLAGGLSKRMKSRTSKIFFKVSGKPMIDWAIEGALALEPEKVFVVGSRENKDELRKICEKYDSVEVIVQEFPRGTGDALNTIRDLVKEEDVIYVAPGDAPLIRPSTIRNMFDEFAEFNVDSIVLSAEVPNPEGYGRVIETKDGIRIVEDKDANEDEKKIKDINGGFYVFRAGKVFEALKYVRPNNSQGEYYLTDVFNFLEKWRIYKVDDWREILGVNTRRQLAEVEGYMQERIKNELMDMGVTLIMPETIYVECWVEIGEDSTIYPHVVLLGKTKIGRNCVIGPMRVLKDEVILDNTVLL